MRPRHPARLALVLMTVLCSHAQGARAAPKTSLGDGSHGYIEFKTLTLTGDQLLAGSTTGPDYVVSGQLMFPRGGEKVPAVILSHGGGGIGRTEPDWAADLRSLGVATFLVDSFSGRRIINFPPEHLLSRRGQAIDFYRAVALLATHPKIDAKRIVFMGWSRGGGVAIMAVESMRSSHFPPNADVVGCLALYPSFPAGDDFSSWQVPARPIRIFQGVLDDVAPLSVARRFVETQRARGIDVKMFEYPHAHHVFDNRASPFVPTPTRIGTVAYNGKAASQVVRDMKASLAEIFGLK